MPRYLKLTQEEFDKIINDSRCTLAHKMVIAGRIERGEWEIIETERKPEESKNE
ncbi:hypothetical protein [Methanochimaera problematica]|uniref:hypothetical protein n=1 Tax=Methanochimaera problematica TaxID=2609417 RepID=UPI002938E452|nr:hypothetical protein [Methanoplanus sp. FWC-SCC4]